MRALTLLALMTLSTQAMAGISYWDGEADYDGDGLTNDEELAIGTDPWEVDTDGDGYRDGNDDDPLREPSLADEGYEDAPTDCSSSVPEEEPFLGGLFADDDEPFEFGTRGVVIPNDDARTGGAIYGGQEALNQVFPSVNTQPCCDLQVFGDNNPEVGYAF